ncbi:MAG: DUF2505 domain-containing protein [Actinomycetota bacterium]|nr:DUF2505 domain-containing protein [Actinomycetota bacterium]
MGTQLQFAQVYPADPAQVLTMVCDPDYIAARAKATGALTVTHTREDGADSSVDLVIVRTLPAEMPSYAKSIVGDTLTITEHQMWGLANEHSCDGRFEVQFSAPLTFKGTVQMTFDGSHTTVVTAGEIKAAVPFVGGKVERLALEQTERYLRKEEEFARQWILKGSQSI